jgi:hypothetical protein
MFRRAITFFVLLTLPIISPPAMGGDSIPAPPPQASYPAISGIRMPEKAKIDSYRANKEYQYGKDYKLPETTGFFGRLWKWILSLWEKAVKALKYLPLALRILFYLLCLALVLVIATKTKIYRIFYTDKEIKEPDYFEENPLDEQFDFDQAISLQISHQNYRNAIRLLHLKILKELETKGVIKFSREKTNREYAREISSISLKNDFFALAGIYNRVWFGNYNLSRNEYDQLASGFYKFSEAINGQEE